MSSFELTTSRRAQSCVKFPQFNSGKNVIDSSYQMLIRIKRGGEKAEYVTFLTPIASKFI